MQPSTPQHPTDQAPVPPHRPLTRYYGEDAERERSGDHPDILGPCFRGASAFRARYLSGEPRADAVRGTASSGRG